MSLSPAPEFFEAGRKVRFRIPSELTACESAFLECLAKQYGYGPFTICKTETREGPEQRYPFRFTLSGPRSGMLERSDGGPRLFNARWFVEARDMLGEAIERQDAIPAELRKYTLFFMETLCEGPCGNVCIEHLRFDPDGVWRRALVDTNWCRTMPRTLLFDTVSEIWQWSPAWSAEPSACGCAG